jgi:hypothetical protein
MDKYKNLENKRTTVRLAAFLLAIVPTSITVSFAAFLGNAYLMAIALLPCVFTLAVSMIPTPMSARAILLCGVASCLISLVIIVYTMTMHLDKLKPYLHLPF